MPLPYRLYTVYTNEEKEDEVPDLDEENLNRNTAPLPARFYTNREKKKKRMRNFMKKIHRYKNIL